VDRIATALRAERDEAEAALTRYGDDGAYHALRDTNAALEKTREALERIQQWIQAWDVPREDGRLTEDEIMEVIAEALTDATPPSQPVEPRSPHKPR
jgi:phage I-like protein